MSSIPFASSIEDPRSRWCGHRVRNRSRPCDQALSVKDPKNPHNKLRQASPGPFSRRGPSPTYRQWWQTPALDQQFSTLTTPSNHLDMSMFKNSPGDPTGSWSWVPFVALGVRNSSINSDSEVMGRSLGANPHLSDTPFYHPHLLQSPLHREWSLWL